MKVPPENKISSKLLVPVRNKQFAYLPLTSLGAPNVVLSMHSERNKLHPKILLIKKY